MEKWNKVINSRVVHMFRNMAFDLWGLDIHFYSKSNDCINSAFHIRNTLCSLIHSNRESAVECISYQSRIFKDLNGTPKTLACCFYENLKFIAVPIIVRGNHLGSMVCSGIQLPITDDQRERSISRITRYGFSATQIMERYKKARISDSSIEEDVLRPMKEVAKDITSFCEKLIDQEDITRNQSLITNNGSSGKYKSIIGTSKPMKKILNKLDLIEDSESPVLVLGETGTGKELIAIAIHYNSIRKDKAFVIQNCSAFSDTILSSELFGHEKGSFTGAVNEKKGIFEIADGGTLFLDEIGDLSYDVQGKLLRVLENGTFFRVGGTLERGVDVRIITATNKDLSAMVEAGTFRRDLLFRINTLQINLPPLRERRDDIESLFLSFLTHYRRKKNIGEKKLNPDLTKILKEHDWKGNIRELKNVVESLVAMSSKSETIEPEHLPLPFREVNYKEPSSNGHNDEGKKLQEVVRATDEEMVRSALEKKKWNKTRAARELGISRASLDRRIEKYNLSKKMT